MVSISLIQAIILSIIQGVTEWLPVSSSGHLALFQEFFGFQNLAYDIFLHFASVFAVFVIFWKDILKLLRFDKESLKYLAFLIIGLIPAIIIGFFLIDKIEMFLSNMFYLGLFFIFSGIVIYLTKFSAEKKEKINFFDSCFIGTFQAIAVLPGISRSGMTISAGLFKGLTKEQSIKFSFIMAIPIIFGAALLEFNKPILSEINYLVLITSFIITFLVSLFTLNLLIKIIKKDKFYLFGIYNILLGVFVLIWSFLR